MSEKRKKASTLLSGVGFYRMALQRRKTLTIVLSISVGVHILGLLIFGGMVVMRHRAEEVTIFETPPPAKRYKPRELEHKVKIQKRQRSSSRPSLTPRLVSMKLSDLALPDIKMDPKIVNTTFQPKFKAVSGKGLGAGLGTGYGTSGFGKGISRINFFGVHAKGERVAILLDVSVSMVETQRGGAIGYMAVKQRIESIIKALNPGSLFTVIAYADAARTIDKLMWVATQKNKTKARTFVRPYNTEGNWGLSEGNVHAKSYGVRALGGTTRLDLALTGAMKMGADTILLISDGLPRVKKGLSRAQVQNHIEETANWNEAHAGDITAWNQANAAAQVVEEKVWVSGQPAQPAQPGRPARPPSKQPPKEGQPIDRGSPAIPPQPARPATPGYFQMVQHRVGGAEGARPTPPPRPTAGWWTLADFTTHINGLHKAYYEKKGSKPPVVHGIGYQIDNDGSAFLKDLSRIYKGQYRRVRSLK
jgi:hypothetical protein